MAKQSGPEVGPRLPLVAGPGAHGAVPVSPPSGRAAGSVQSLSGQFEAVTCMAEFHLAGCKNSTDDFANFFVGNRLDTRVIEA